MLGRPQSVSATRLSVTLLLAGSLIVACGGSVDAKADGGDPGDSPDGSPQTDTGAINPGDAGDSIDASAPGDDASEPAADAAYDAALPVYPPDPGDGTPTRITCTESLGTGLSASFGRLDGTIVSIVPSKTHKCNGDSTHLHLQVLANGGTYDVAVNVDALFFEKDAPLVVEPWAEGWHLTPEKLDYVSMLSVHSTQFAQPTIPQLTAQLEAELAAVNHVSIFGTGYGPDGMHLIHRNGASNDGAVILHPLGASPHYLLFNFDTQTF